MGKFPTHYFDGSFTTNATDSFSTELSAIQSIPIIKRASNLYKADFGCSGIHVFVAKFTVWDHTGPIKVLFNNKGLNK